MQALQNDVNQLWVSFAAIRDDVIAKLNQCTDHMKTVETLSRQATEMNSALENKLADASIAEKKWKDIQDKLATTAISGRVILDVGGKKYSTSVETLTREKNTFFTALFSTQWKLELDPGDKSIFIDRDGKLFRHTLTYFRTGRVPLDVMSDESLRQSLIIEAEYFGLQGLHSILTGQRAISPFFSDGTLLRTGYKETLNEFYGKKDQQWSLIYKASRDGFDASAFHVRCNNQGPTMTIVQSKNNYLFGGYTAVPWTSDCVWMQDSTAFLFTLTNPHNIPPRKYSINAEHSTHAVCHGGGNGPTFGAGHDLMVAGSSNVNNLSYTKFPTAYIDTTSKGNGTFTGAETFTASEIEVYKLS